MSTNYTNDPQDPRLGHGVNDVPAPENEVYLVLPEGERAQGFVRPVRRTYVHVGVGGHEVDPLNPARHGRVHPGCGVATTMGAALAETYAREPGFYGATYCAGCQMHRQVGEFEWGDGSGVVGS